MMQVAMQNMKRGYLRHFGGGESKRIIKSMISLHPSYDTVPYGIVIDTLKAKECSLLQKLILLVAGGESTRMLKSMHTVQPPAIKRLGDRIWAGLRR